MEWGRLLAYITGTVDQELLLRNEYLAAENRILSGQLKGLCILKTLFTSELCHSGIIR
jgi:putative transposase